MLAGNTAFAPSSYESIATATPTGASVTFSSIPQTYKHLQVRMITRVSSSTTSDVIFTVNGASSSGDYAVNHVRGAAPTSTGAYFDSSVAYLTALQSAGTGSTSDLFGVAIIDFNDYANTTRQKSMWSVYGTVFPSTSNGQIRIQGSLYRYTTAISSLTFTDSSAGNFISGTRISLYGIKG
jgi:hypothetical protein